MSKIRSKCAESINICAFNWLLSARERYEVNDKIATDTKIPYFFRTYLHQFH